MSKASGSNARAGKPAPAGEAPAVEAPADIPPYRYGAGLAGQFEEYWQEYWDEHGTFHAPNPVGDLANPEHPRAGAEKLFVLDMFPYPSGSGLHVGHPLGYIGTDCYGRYQRMAGRNVLHAMGFDAFGLPAEQYAVQTGKHPRLTTEDNVRRYRTQLRRLGLGYDARRSVATTDVAFYRWTQWIFLQIFNSWYDPDARKARPIADLITLYEKKKRSTPDGRPWAKLSDMERRQIIDDHRLAYVSEAPVNWCPGLGTVLSNEEVTADGRSDRGNFPVFKRNLKQWMMRITAYGDRLLEDLDTLDWPEPVKLMQRHWIGRSTGAHIDFPVDRCRSHPGVHHAPRHDLRRHLHGGRAGARGRRRDDRRCLAGCDLGVVDRWARHPGGGSGRVPGVRGQGERGRAYGRVEGEDRRLRRRLRHQPSDGTADPGIHR